MLHPLFKFRARVGITAACAVAVSVVAVAGQAPENASVKNPVPASPESVAAGQQLYLRQCASCHGKNGQGGPGNDLIPAAPGLLGDHWEHGSTDGDDLRQHPERHRSRLQHGALQGQAEGR